MVKLQYFCEECGKPYDSSDEAVACETSDKKILQQIPIGEVIDRAIGQSYTVLDTKLVIRHGKRWRWYQIKYTSGETSWTSETTILAEQALVKKIILVKRDFVSGEVQIYLTLRRDFDGVVGLDHESSISIQVWTPNRNKKFGSALTIPDTSSLGEARKNIHVYLLTKLPTTAAFEEIKEGILQAIVSLQQDEKNAGRPPILHR